MEVLLGAVYVHRSGERLIPMSQSFNRTCESCNGNGQGIRNGRYLGRCGPCRGTGQMVGTVICRHPEDFKGCGRLPLIWSREAFLEEFRRELREGQSGDLFA